jgi:hypothetical protein
MSLRVDNPRECIEPVALESQIPSDVEAEELHVAFLVLLYEVEYRRALPCQLPQRAADFDTRWERLPALHGRKRPVRIISNAHVLACCAVRTVERCSFGHEQQDSMRERKLLKSPRRFSEYLVLR